MHPEHPSYPQDTLIAGVDEAGRGPWFGPVFAAAVILDPARPIAGLTDSKALTAHKRDALFAVIQSRALAWAIAEASAAEIDSINILQASLLAMQRAVNLLPIKPDAVLVDGKHCPALTVPTQAVIKGDSKIQAISAASILAKVARDQRMVEYHQQYPQFSFHQHKGYGTRQHQSELTCFGVLEEHRKSFAPVKKLLASG